MIRTILAALFFFTQIFVSQAFACSAFGGGNSAIRVMGKSYDFQLTHGIGLINKRHVKKVALVGPRDKAAEWTSKYGSITYTQFGRDLPISGLNEKGLAIEILWDFDTDGPDNKGTLPAVNEAQWIQYQLDISANVAEVIANSKLVRMKKVYAPIHYLACDSQGACATFEFNKDKVIIHDTGASPTLTNSTYQDGVEFLKEFNGFGGNKGIPFGSYDSNDRFVILNSQTGTLNGKNTVADAVAYGFSMLKTVRASISVWNMMHDLKNGVSYFKRLFEERITRETRLADYDLSCKTPAKIVDLEDTSAKFADYDPALNRETVEISGRALGMDKALIDAVANYPDTTICTDLR